MTYEQRLIPNYVHVIVDYKNLGDSRWCLILNNCPHYFPGTIIDISPIYVERCRAIVDDCNGTTILIRDFHPLLIDRIIGSLVFSNIDIDDVARWLTFKEQRDHGCFTNDIIRILKDNGVSAPL